MLQPSKYLVKLVKKMKIIAFGDIHMATDHLAAINDITDADAVLLTGDLTNFGGRDDANVVLQTLKQLNPGIFAIPGNLDKPEVSDLLEDMDINLHGQARLIETENDRICVYGVGGSNKTPFNTPLEFSEEELAAIAEQGARQAAKLIADAQKRAGRNIPTVFLSHTPPFETDLDRLSGGGHAGSPAIRKHIETFQPDICITGHIHESRGEQTIGKTIVLNPGILAQDGNVLLTVEESSITAQLR